MKNIDDTTELDNNNTIELARILGFISGFFAPGSEFESPKEFFVYLSVIFGLSFVVVALILYFS